MNNLFGNADCVETAYAKINLALHIRSRRADGYHLIDTIFAFVDDGDHLQAAISADLTLQITGPYAADLSADNDNLVLRAAHAVRDHYGVQHGAAITLNKRLPVASGIGGGSADAAAAARLLCRLWNVSASFDELADILAPLGADIPACVESKTVRGQGTGTILQPVNSADLAGTSVLLVNPNVAVATGTVFSRWQGIDSGPLSGNTARGMMMEGTNDLQPLALSVCPEIGNVLAALSAYKSIIARMSGSGATCFALFPNADECAQAQQQIALQYPEYWTMAGKIL